MKFVHFGPGSRPTFENFFLVWKVFLIDFLSKMKSQKGSLGFRTILRWWFLVYSEEIFKNNSRVPFPHIMAVHMVCAWPQRGLVATNYQSIFNFPFWPQWCYVHTKNTLHAYFSFNVKIEEIEKVFFFAIFYDFPIWRVPHSFAHIPLYIAIVAVNFVVSYDFFLTVAISLS